MMKTSWTNGLSEQEKSDLKASFASSLVMRKRLTFLAEEKINSSTRYARNKLTYDNPNWAFLQADQRGYERALTEIIDLLFDEQKEK